MTPIIITVGERTIGIEDQNDVNDWLETLKVQSFVDENGVERRRFSRLVDGGTYTLGPPIQQQPNGKWRCCFCFVFMFLVLK